MDTKSNDFIDFESAQARKNRCLAHWSTYIIKIKYPDFATEHANLSEKDTKHAMLKNPEIL